MTGETVTQLETFLAPYGREVRLQDVAYESGMRLMRVTIREGRRFTTLEIDPATAAEWGSALSQWAKNAGSADG